MTGLLYSRGRRPRDRKVRPRDIPSIDGAGRMVEAIWRPRALADRTDYAIHTLCPSGGNRGENLRPPYPRLLKFRASPRVGAVRDSQLSSGPRFTPSAAAAPAGNVSRFAGRCP